MTAMQVLFTSPMASESFIPSIMRAPSMLTITNFLTGFQQLTVDFRVGHWQTPLEWHPHQGMASCELKALSFLSATQSLA